jgi:hypothetical protein
MVGLVVKAPLRDHKTRARVFARFDHGVKVVALLFLQRLEFFDAVDLNFMLGLGFRGLKGAGQDGDLDVFQLFWHLRVRKVLVEHDAAHQARVVHRAARFSLELFCCWFFVCFWFFF